MYINRRNWNVIKVWSCFSLADVSASVFASRDQSIRPTVETNETMLFKTPRFFGDDPWKTYTHTKIDMSHKRGLSPHPRLFKQRGLIISSIPWIQYLKLLSKTDQRDQSFWDAVVLVDERPQALWCFLAPLSECSVWVWGWKNTMYCKMYNILYVSCVVHNCYRYLK